MLGLSKSFIVMSSVLQPMALVGCVCSTSSSASLLQQQRIAGWSSRCQQGYAVPWNRSLQDSRFCTPLLVQKSTLSLFQNGRKGEVICQVAVKVGQSSEGKETNVKVGSRIRVTVPLTVYHVLKLPNLNLQGLEGELKDHLVEWKGKTISATLPYRVQFEQEVDGKTVKFFAHLRDDEFEVIL
ncbi:hypothetical protein R1sor_003362 [Riccia sorocarpa]|uniref:Ferredoxin thioredoxin reductase alpha chain domain-containing protein n=1 Tax=Riccia sorocarpa TaxID=122646 RepID=A0ABD3H4R5_9MARC